MEDLLPYFERELVQLRQLGKEFSERYPAIAGRLQLSGDINPDPHIEQLIQSLALLSSRIAKKLDDSYPEFTESLLELLFPHYLRPFPSCSIVRASHIANKSGCSASRLFIPRGCEMDSCIVKGIRCRFRTTYDIELSATNIVHAQFNPHIRAPTGLRLPPASCASISVVIDEMCCNSPDRLRIFIDADPTFCAVLRDVLFMRTACAFLELEKGRWIPLSTLPVSPVGFARNEAMIPYFFNGTGVNSNSARAYAFWQRAAEMGNPSAMAHLGKKLLGVWDDPQRSFWNNRPNGIKMLECALSQGEGKAAYYLGLSYYIQPGRDSTREERWRALQILHEGVKFGSKDCANSLDIEFGNPLEISKMMAPNIDRARAVRYSILYDALSFDPSDRFPNLDKVLPLPPARLPPWNGDRDTLLWAARGVTVPATVPEPSAASQRSGRYFLDAAFALRDTGQETRATRAPMEGYWQPLARSVKPEEQQQLKDVMPGLYRRDEAFTSFMSQHGHGALNGIIWRRWDTVRLPLDAVAPLAPVGMTKAVPRPHPLQSCSSGTACPVTGTWQPWVRSDHPLHLAINQYWRQAWLVKGQIPPDPQRDWHLPIDAVDVTWHLMDSSPVNLLKDGE